MMLLSGASARINGVGVDSTIDNDQEHNRKLQQKEAWEPFTEDESYPSQTSWFGEGQSRKKNGPISTVFCRRNKHCTQIQLKANLPDLNGIPASEQVMFKDGGYWSKWFGNDDAMAASCGSNDFVVTGIQCRNEKCKEMRLRCSQLRQKRYQVNRSFITSTRWTTQTSGKAQCETGSYVVGMQCKGRGGENACSRLRLECAKVEFNTVVLEESLPLFDEYSSESNDENKSKKKPKLPMCSDKVPDNKLIWADADGYTCDEYELYDFCGSYGHMYQMDQLTANTACCACGGGNRR